MSLTLRPREDRPAPVAPRAAFIADDEGNPVLRAALREGLATMQRATQSPMDALLQRAQQALIDRAEPSAAPGAEPADVAAASTGAVAVAAAPAPTPSPVSPSVFAGFMAATRAAYAASVATAAPVTPPAATAPAPAPAFFAGEPPVQQAWLEEREVLLRQIRADYQSAAAAARGQRGGIGWVEVPAPTPSTDFRGNFEWRFDSRSRGAVWISADGRSGPAPRPTISHTGPVEPSRGAYRGGGTPAPAPAPEGRWMRFDEASFARWYRSQPNESLNQLAALYGAPSVRQLFVRHKGIWEVATREHALNDGPAPAGVAMGDETALLTVDLYLSDPDIQELIARFGATEVPPAATVTARELVRVYGQERYEQLCRLDAALARVRNDYAHALAEARSDPRSVGWVTTTRAVGWDEGGQILRTETNFSVDAFTEWYVSQPGLSAHTFGQMYGRATTRDLVQFGGRDAGTVTGTYTGFDAAGWSLNHAGTRLEHAMQRVRPDDPPRLHDARAVGFDLSHGWVTSRDNVHRDENLVDRLVDVVDRIAPVIVVAGLVIMTSGMAEAAGATAGSAVGGGAGATGAAGAAGAATGSGLAAVVSAGVTGLVSGAVAGLASGIVNGSLQWRDVLRSALVGGLSAGLIEQFGGARGTLQHAGARITVQGALQELTGGNFRDGALTALAASLADFVSTELTAGLRELPADQLPAARTAIRLIGSAIRAMANPDNPARAFATDLLNQLMAEAMPPEQRQPAFRPVFDDEGYLMPGVVDPQATPAQQQAQLAAHLEAQGFSADDAARLAATRFAPPAPMGDPFNTISDSDEATYRQRLAEQLGIPVEDLQDAGFWGEAARSFEVLRGFAEGAGFSILGTGEAILDIVRSPGQFVNGVKLLLTSTEARARLGEDVVARIQTDVQMLEDAWQSGDLRGIGQQLGKLTTDFAQVAGGVEALAGLGVSATTAGGRLLLNGADAVADALRLSAPGLFDAAGRPLMDFRALSTTQKQMVGELMGAETVQRLVPDAQRISRLPAVGETGIDDLYRVSRPDVDFVVVEYKFGAGRLGHTVDGLQMSDNWLTGTTTGDNRLLRAVNNDQVVANDMRLALEQGRIERWLVHTDPLGNVTVGLLDSNGRFIPQPVSRLLGGD